DNVFVMIIHAGGAEENRGTYSQIWSHQWTLDSDNSGYQIGNKKFYAYSTFAEFSVEGGTPVSIAAHEFGHQLGASDFYDNGSTSYKGMGRWSLMSGGVWQGSYFASSITEWWGVDFEAYHKMKFGWVTPVVLNDMIEDTHELGLYPLSDTESTNQDKLIYRYNLNSDGTEYYLIEMRKQIDYDRYLFTNSTYKTGALITHIDENVKLDGTIYLDNFVYSHTSDVHPALWLVRSDNRADSTEDINDLYPSNVNNDFTPTTQPSSYGYNTFNAPILKEFKREGTERIDFTFINRKTFVYSVAANPFDTSTLHVYVRPNFDFNGTLHAQIKDTSENTIGDEAKLSPAPGGLLYTGNIPLTEIPEGDFRVYVRAEDGGEEIASDNAVLSFEHSTSPRFAVYENNFDVAENIRVISDSKNAYTYDGYVHKVSGRGRVNEYFNTQTKEYVEFLSGDDFEPVIGTENFTGDISLRVSSDNTPPVITVGDSVSVEDDGAGIKSVVFYDLNDREVLRRAPSAQISPPGDAVYVVATDNVGNITRKSIMRNAPGNILRISAYPNPASNGLYIRYSLAALLNCDIDIYNTSGRKIHNAFNPAGSDTFYWDLTDRRGRGVANGVYFVKLTCGTDQSTMKVVVLR
ncbi:MAG: immune inhibitor A domain-containing protein, partial [Candidatus Muiribacteriaceae bacterium]